MADVPAARVGEINSGDGDFSSRILIAQTASETGILA
jgi:hypothetical protein